MTMPRMPGQQQIVTPPIHKTPVTCCGYTALQPVPKPWECPGCHKIHNADAR